MEVRGAENRPAPPRCTYGKCQCPPGHERPRTRWVRWFLCLETPGSYVLKEHTLPSRQGLTALTSSRCRRRARWSSSGRVTPEPTGRTVLTPRRSPRRRAPAAIGISRPGRGGSGSRRDRGWWSPSWPACNSNTTAGGPRRMAADLPCDGPDIRPGVRPGVYYSSGTAKSSFGPTVPRRDHARHSLVHNSLCRPVSTVIDWPSAGALWGKPDRRQAWPAVSSILADPLARSRGPDSQAGVGGKRILAGSSRRDSRLVPQC